MRRTWWWWAVLLAGTLAGCVESETAEQAGAAAAAIRAAAQVGADRRPQSAYFLRIARNETRRAQDLIDAGDDARAVGLLSRAQADAELALSLAVEDSLRREAATELAHVHALQSRHAM